MIRYVLLGNCKCTYVYLTFHVSRKWHGREILIQRDATHAHYSEPHNSEARRSVQSLFSSPRARSQCEDASVNSLERAPRGLKRKCRKAISQAVTWPFVGSGASPAVLGELGSPWGSSSIQRLGPISGGPVGSGPR